MFGNSGPSKGGPFNDMQIGTWDGGSSGGGGGGGGGGGHGNNMDHSRNMDSNGRMDHRNMDRMGGGQSGNGGMGGGGGGGGSPGSFEIGTFFVPTPQNGYGSGSGGNQDGSGGREAGPPQRGIYHPQPNPAAASGGGPGIRETGIIEKLLVSSLLEINDQWVTNLVSASSSKRPS